MVPLNLGYLISDSERVLLATWQHGDISVGEEAATVERGGFTFNSINRRSPLSVASRRRVSARDTRYTGIRKIPRYLK